MFCFGAVCNVVKEGKKVLYLGLGVWLLSYWRLSLCFHWRLLVFELRRRDLAGEVWGVGGELLVWRVALVVLLMGRVCR